MLTSIAKIVAATCLMDLVAVGAERLESGEDAPLLQAMSGQRMGLVVESFGSLEEADTATKDAAAKDEVAKDVAAKSTSAASKEPVALMGDEQPYDALGVARLGRDVGFVAGLERAGTVREETQEEGVDPLRGQHQMAMKEAIHPALVPAFTPMLAESTQEVAAAQPLPTPKGSQLGGVGSLRLVNQSKAGRQVLVEVDEAAAVHTGVAGRSQSKSEDPFPLLWQWGGAKDPEMAEVKSKEAEGRAPS